MRHAGLIVLGFLLLGAPPVHAEFGVEEVDDAGGVTNPSDFSWRTYREAMNRFPDRLGIICRNAFELHKSGEHPEALAFFTECAERGNAPSMINLAVIYDLGLGTPPDATKSTQWLKRAAETNYSAAQYDYGLALLRGYGVPRDEVSGRDWIAKAAAQGDSDALKLVRAGFNLAAPGIAGF